MTRAIRLLRSAVGRPVRRGFTLIETMVAIGVIALVGVGLAAIFETVSDTVAGGRRISRFAQTATIIERQMRADIDRMSRDGFLVIRQQFAQANPDATIETDPAAGPTQYDGVPISLEDPEPRMRRVDELVFFARGAFESARQPLHPTLGVRSNEARIYYGHGRKARQREASDQVRSLPRAPFFYNADAALERSNRFLERDANERGLGVRPVSNNDLNPNEFAGDWTLLRHVTLLVPPTDTLPDTDAAIDDLFGAGAPPTDPSQDPFNATYPRGTTTTDATQVYQGQPAARFLFRDVLRSLEVDAAEVTPTVRPERDLLSPRFDSGLVDIALTTLDETARIIERSTEYPPVDVTQYQPPGVTPLGDNVSPLQSAPLSVTSSRLLTSTSGAGPGDRRVGGAAAQDRLDTVQGWMEQLLPAYSYVVSPTGAPRGERMRTESGPTDFETVITDEGGDITNNAVAGGEDLAVEIARADQIAMSMSNLAPRCTEFIVEWSFGQVYDPEFYLGAGPHPRREGEIVWYGANSLDPATLRPDSITRYPEGDARSGEPPVEAYRPFPNSESPNARDHVLSSSLVYGPRTPVFGLDARTCFFGRVDETYPQTSATLDPADPNAVPWAWPKLLRVTFTLADALDPTIEETYQYVFELPADPEP